MLHRSIYSSDTLHQDLVDDLARCIFYPRILVDIDPRLFESIKCIYQDEIIAFYIYNSDIIREYDIYNILDKNTEKIIKLLEKGWKNSIFRRNDETYHFQFPFKLGQNYLIKKTEKYYSLQFRFDKTESYLDWLPDELLIDIIIMTPNIDNLIIGFPKINRIFDNLTYLKYILNKFNMMLNNATKKIIEQYQLSAKDQIDIITHLINNEKYWIEDSYELPMVILSKIVILDHQKLLFEIYLKYKLEKWYQIYNIYMEIDIYGDTKLNLDRKYQIIKNIVYSIAIRLENEGFKNNDEQLSIPNSIMRSEINRPYLDSLLEVWDQVCNNQK